MIIIKLKLKPYFTFLKAFFAICILGAGFGMGLAHAYIPPSRMILTRLAENNGNGLYQIEQELQFLTSSEILTVRETWYTAGEKGLRLIAVGQGDLKDKFYFQAAYVGGNRWIISQGKKESQKISPEMIERPFHFRSLESLAQWMIGLEILPSNFFQLKPYLKDRDGFTYPQEPFVRLGRSGGTITYAFGAAPTENPNKNLPGIWIEQDLFDVRKVRWPSQGELNVEELGSYSRNLVFPKSRNFRWGNQSLQINTLSVVGKPPSPATQNLLNLNASRANLMEGFPQKDLLVEFYQRFR